VSLQSIRSGISDTERAIEDIQTKIVEIEVDAELGNRQDVKNKAQPLRGRVDELKTQKERIRATRDETLWFFFTSLVCLIAAIMLGIVGVASSGFWLVSRALLYADTFATITGASLIGFVAKSGTDEAMD